MCSTTRLYAAMRDQTCIGVFSDEERAAAVTCDEILPIEPAWLAGTPEPCGYACLAAGTWITLERIEGGFEAHYTDVGPCWGVNVQSAIGGLFGQPVTRRNIELSSLQLYEIDRDYSVRPPENLKHDYRFLCDVFAGKDGPSREELAFDHIERHLRNLRYLEKQGAKYDSLYLEVILDKLSELAWRRRPPRCGYEARNFRQRMEKQFARRFTLTELRILTVLWGLRADDAVTDQLIRGKISPEQARDILERARLCLQPRPWKPQGKPEE